MGCLTVELNRVTSSLVACIGKRNSLGVTIGKSSKDLALEIFRHSSLGVSTSRQKEPLQVTLGVICSIPEELVLYFVKNKLVWEGETNKEGVVKYNTLIATGDWKLEEVTIEELL